MAGSITIELNDLHFFAKHGVYKEEEKVEHEFTVNIAVVFKAPKKEIHALHQTINYVAVYTIVQEVFAEKKQLLETCAMQISQRIAYQYPFIKRVYINIKKNNPPVVNFTGSVGVSYSRRFK